MGDQTALQGDEEGAVENMQGDHSDDRSGLLPILDYVLTVSDSAGGKEWAGQPQPYQGDLLEGAGVGMKSGMALNFAEVFWHQ